MSAVFESPYDVKRTKSVLIAVPTFENIAPETFKSIFQNLKNSRVENLDFDFVKGYDCARARNKIVEKAIDGKYDHVLMVDSDIILPNNAIDLFMDWEFDVIFGYSPRKNDPSVTEIYKNNSGWSKDFRFTMDELKKSDVEIMVCDGGSFGCVWIATDIFKKLEKPYFDYINYPNGKVLSEDLYFCRAVKRAGIDLYLNTKIACKHIGKRIVE